MQLDMKRTLSASTGAQGVCRSAGGGTCSVNQPLQETESDTDVAETVRLAVVLLEVAARKLAAPDKVIVAAERKLDLEAVGLGFDLHHAAGLP